MYRCDLVFSRGGGLMGRESKNAFQCLRNSDLKMSGICSIEHSGIYAFSWTNTKAFIRVHLLLPTYRIFNIQSCPSRSEQEFCKVKAKKDVIYREPLLLPMNLQYLYLYAQIFAYWFFGRFASGLFTRTWNWDLYSHFVRGRDMWSRLRVISLRDLNSVFNIWEWTGRGLLPASASRAAV
jgi:hypothetical protein